MDFKKKLRYNVENIILSPYKSIFASMRETSCHPTKKTDIIKEKQMKKKKRRNSQKQPLNRNRRDRLFRLAFQDRKDLLELYNAVNQTSYKDPDQLEITTLADAVFLGVKNDLSFIIGASMNLYEHQSTRCGNMPLRGLIYFSALYQNYVKRHGYNLYGSSTIQLPFPNYLIFYNGEAGEPDESEMFLSEAFQKPDKDVPPAVECRVKMLNINRGHNSELMKGCRRLREYAEFIGRIQDNIRDGQTVRDAVNEAMDTCQRLGILSDLLGRCRTEVLNMLLAEYNEKETMEYIRKEQRQIGREEGKLLGKSALVLALLEDIGRIPDGLRRHIQEEHDEKRLKEWCRLATHVKSVEEFQEKYQDI